MIVDPSSIVEIVGISTVIAGVVNTVLVAIGKTEQAEKLAAIKERAELRVAQVETKYAELKGKVEAFQEMKQGGFSPQEIDIIRAELRKGLGSIQSRLGGDAA